MNSWTTIPVDEVLVGDVIDHVGIQGRVRSCSLGTFYGSECFVIGVEGTKGLFVKPGVSVEVFR